MKYVEKNIIKGGHINILELNCGTGEDAIRFHKAGNEVFATDISAEMIKVSKTKLGPTEIKGITFMQLSMTDLPQEWMKGKFDLVFSNFGGLNCIDKNELENKLNEVLSNLPDRCQQVFTMSRFENKRNKEIAAELDISIKAVEKQITKALATIRTEMKDYLPLLLFLSGHLFEN